jgi:hypothetical protein
MPLLSMLMAMFLAVVTVHKFVNELPIELIHDFIFDMLQNFQWMAILIC